MSGGTRAMADEPPRTSAPPARHALRGRVLTFGAAPGADGVRHHGDGARYHEDGLVVIEGERIAAVGDAGPLLAAKPGLAVVDHRPHLLVPGLVDPHLHMPQTRVIASHGATLLEWLRRYTFPEESRYADPAVCEEAAAFVLDELLRNGTTCGAFFCTSHPESAEALFDAAERRGMRIVAGKVMMDRGAPDALLDTPERAHEETEALIARRHGRGRAEVAITPRFAVTSTEAQLEVAGALARAHPDAPIQTHLNENEGEIAFVAEAFPRAEDYTAVYERYGLVRPRALFGHCIHMRERETRAMAEAGASAIHCPTSNLFLGSGLFDRAAMRGAGVPVGVATDIGGGTSYSLLRTAAEAYKVAAMRGEVWEPLELLRQITRGNAEAMGLQDRIGSLAPGLEADIAVLDARATPAMRRRMEAVETLSDEVFALLVLGDDRAVAATYAAGRCVWRRMTAREPGTA